MYQPCPREANRSTLNLQQPLRCVLEPQRRKLQWRKPLRMKQQAMAVGALTAMPCRPMIKFA